jgi:putative transposase
MQVLGGLARRTLVRGELRAALRAISQDLFLVPGTDRHQHFSVTTLERWYYALRRFGMVGLQPKVRTDRGRARALTDEQKKLVFDIRCEFPHASAPLILKTLQREGRIDNKAISAATLRRYFAQEGVQKSIASKSERAPRLRWQAETAGTLFHADVCHGPSICVAGRIRPLRVHAILDDASRYIVAIRVAYTEKESDMLTLLVMAWRAWGTSNLLYLDNGATYRGEVMATACARLGTTVMHAKPYDPRARGKMERFWRTLREGCLSYLGAQCSLDEVNTRVQLTLLHKSDLPDSQCLIPTVQAMRKDIPSVPEGLPTDTPSSL